MQALLLAQNLTNMPLASHVDTAFLFGQPTLSQGEVTGPNTIQAAESEVGNITPKTGETPDRAVFLNAEKLATELAKNLAKQQAEKLAETQAETPAKMQPGKQPEKRVDEQVEQQVEKPTEKVEENLAGQPAEGSEGQQGRDQVEISGPQGSIPSPLYSPVTPAASPTGEEMQTGPSDESDKRTTSNPFFPVSSPIQGLAQRHTTYDRTTPC
jgi:hypothetical protein